MDEVRDTTEAVACKQFAANVARELDVLHGDPQAWSAYLGEAELAVDDGIA
jgi:hypothetical protein